MKLLLPILRMMTTPGKGIQMEKIHGNLGGKQKDIAMADSQRAHFHKLIEVERGKEIT